MNGTERSSGLWSRAGAAILAGGLAVAGVHPLSVSGAAAQQHAPAPAATPAPAPDVLDGLLAPIALYPDQLLAQMLLCAANPSKVAALSEWLTASAQLKGTELQDAAARAGFEASFVDLAIFPHVVETMANDLEWTSKLGRAFAADRTAVFASVQRLRHRAETAGTLKTTPQQSVETRTTSAGQEVIVIEPTNPQVVYVPQYNPTVVYTQPVPSTVVVHEDSSDAVAAGLIGFTAGIAIGAAIDNDYYYGPYGWRGGAYMYDDAWDDWYDDREDAREDWQDHREDVFEDRSDAREDLAESRGDRAQTAQQERTDRQQTRQETRPETQAQREQRRTDAQASGNSVSQESRGFSRDGQAAGERAGTRSDAMSGYSSGRSERAASQRGQKSRGSSRSGGGRRR